MPMDNKTLFRLAREAQINAYAPYSKFYVGAAVLTTSGDVYKGSNVENSSYGASICAERVALTKAISNGHRFIDAIAITSSDTDSPTFPCGICRQFIFEFGPDIRIIVGTDEDNTSEYTISELLPEGFRL